MKTRLTIVLEIEGDADDAAHVVNKLLDAGEFQDAINDHGFNAGDLCVTSALLTTVEDVA